MQWWPCTARVVACSGSPTGPAGRERSGWPVRAKGGRRLFGSVLGVGDNGGVLRSFSPVIGLGAVVLAVAGCGGGAASAQPQAVKDMGSLRATVPGAYGTPVPLGDVDGDGRPDAFVSDHAGERPWLVLSGHGGSTVVLRHGHAVARLGDLDGDGLQDIALPSDRGTLRVVYGRRARWPGVLDVRARADGRSAVVQGTADRGAPTEAVARDGDGLLAGVDCPVDGCSRAIAYRVRVPARGQIVSLADGEPVRPVAGPLLGPAAPWVGGAVATTAWTVLLPGNPNPDPPELVRAGHTPWRLGDRDLIGDATARAVLIEPQSDAPSGEAVQSSLVLHRLDEGGRTTALRLTESGDASSYSGVLVDAGRCVLVSGTRVPEPPQVWAVTVKDMKVRRTWSFPGASAVTAQPRADGRIDVLTYVSHTGRLARAALVRPSAC